MRYTPEPGDRIVVEMVSGTQATLEVTELRQIPNGAVEIRGVSNGKPTSISSNLIAMIRILETHN